MLLDARVGAHQALAQRRREGRRFHLFFVSPPDVLSSSPSVPRKEKKKPSLLLPSLLSSRALPRAGTREEREGRSRRHARVSAERKRRHGSGPAGASCSRGLRCLSLKERMKNNKSSEFFARERALSESTTTLSSREIVELLLSLSLSLTASSCSLSSRSSTSRHPPLSVSLSQSAAASASIPKQCQMPGDDQQQPSSVLALDAAPAECRALVARPRRALVDALPYVDSLTPSERALTDRLIEAEVRSYTSRR